MSRVKLSRKTLELIALAAGVEVVVKPERGYWSGRIRFPNGRFYSDGNSGNSRAEAERNMQRELRSMIQYNRKLALEKEIRVEEEERATDRILRRVARLPHNRKRQT